MPAALTTKGREDAATMGTTITSHVFVVFVVIPKNRGGTPCHTGDLCEWRIEAPSFLCRAAISRYDAGLAP